jgi:hypothetical protein
MLTGPPPKFHGTRDILSAYHRLQSFADDLCASDGRGVIGVGRAIEGRKDGRSFRLKSWPRL